MNEPSHDRPTFDLNTASAEVLAEQIPALGLFSAEDVVRWRTKNGPIVSVEPLTRDLGLSADVCARIADHIKVPADSGEGSSEAYGKHDEREGPPAPSVATEGARTDPTAPEDAPIGGRSTSMMGDESVDVAPASAGEAAGGTASKPPEAAPAPEVSTSREEVSMSPEEAPIGEDAKAASRSPDDAARAAKASAGRALSLPPSAQHSASPGAADPSQRELDDEVRPAPEPRANVVPASAVTREETGWFDSPSSGASIFLTDEEDAEDAEPAAQSSSSLEVSPAAHAASQTIRTIATPVPPPPEDVGDIERSAALAIKPPRRGFVYPVILGVVVLVNAGLGAGLARLRHESADARAPIAAITTDLKDIHEKQDETQAQVKETRARLDKQAHTLATAMESVAGAVQRQKDAEREAQDQAAREAKEIAALNSRMNRVERRVDDEVFNIEEAMKIIDVTQGRAAPRGANAHRVPSEGPHAAPPPDHGPATDHAKAPAHAPAHAPALVPSPHHAPAPPVKTPASAHPPASPAKPLHAPEPTPEHAPEAKHAPAAAPAHGHAAAAHTTDGHTPDAKSRVDDKHPVEDRHPAEAKTAHAPH